MSETTALRDYLKKTNPSYRKVCLVSDNVNSAGFFESLQFVDPKLNFLPTLLVHHIITDDGGFGTAVVDAAHCLVPLAARGIPQAE